MFNNPADAVPTIPYGWYQVGAAATYNPVNTVASLCPFNGRRAKKTRSYLGEKYQNEVSELSWEHSIGRYVYTLGHTCASMDDPLWQFLWPSKVAPVKTRSSRSRGG